MDPREIAAIPLFAGLSKDDQKIVAQYADEVDVSAGTKLAQEGKLAYEFFSIQDGTAEVTQGGEPIGRLGPGDFFGEIALVYESPRRTATVTAASPLRFFVLTRQSFRSLLEHQPEIEDKVMATLEERLRSDSPA